MRDINLIKKDFGTNLKYVHMSICQLSILGQTSLNNTITPEQYIQQFFFIFLSLGSPWLNRRFIRYHIRYVYSPGHEDAQRVTFGHYYFEKSSKGIFK